MVPDGEKGTWIKIKKYFIKQKNIKYELINFYYL